MRVEKDSIGKREIPEDAYYGINTLRAVENFNISRDKVHPELIKAVALIKKAAAATNYQLDKIEEQKAEAIISAADEIASGKWNDKFHLDALQGGAGTSTNMMINEFIANRALELLGRKKGDYNYIHPNDDVNLGQSTNDVYPTALRIAVLTMLKDLNDRAADLQEALQEKEKQFADIIKLGRTQLQDAVPITLGQEFSAYAEAVNRDRWRIYKISERLKKINLGGTAVGTGVNTSQAYIYKIAQNLRKVSGLSLSHSENMIDITQNMDIFVEVSGLLKAAAVNLNKIASDLRLLSSGPRGGIGEINLPEVQAGSSIMPGKVNPVICEMINQVSIEVICSDQAVTLAARDGQLELNAFGPLIAHRLLNMMEIMKNSLKIFIEKCIKEITANRERAEKILNSSFASVTALVPYLGYDTAVEIAHRAMKETSSIRKILLDENLLAEERIDEILSIEKMTSPGIND